MAHPSASFPKGFHKIGTANTSAVTPSSGSFFTSVLCVTAGDVTLNGGGMYDGASADSSLTITMSAGMIIYGKFDSVASDGTGEFIAYLA